MPNITKKKRGFTLLELTLVMVIIGILAAIAIPNFFSYQQRGYQTEAQVVLGAIASSQMHYKMRNGVYVSCPLNPPKAGGNWSPRMPEWNRIAFKLGGALYYQYEVMADETGFVAYARGKKEDAPDVWEISSKNMAPFQITGNK